MKKTLTIILTLSLFLIVLTVPARMTSPAPFTIYTFDEYQIFIEENDLPEDFIYYDSVSMFGEFKKLEFLTMFTGSFTGNVDNYRYMLEVKKDDEALDYGGYIELEICSVYDEYLKYWGGEQIEGDVDDFLSVDARNGYYIFEDVIYIYDKKGELAAIIWENSEKLFSLFADYKNTTYHPDTIVGKLLDKNTAPEVIEMLKTHEFYEKSEAPVSPETGDMTETTEIPNVSETPNTPKPPEIPTPPETADFSPIFSILSVISAGGFTALAVKKKKNK